MNSQLTLDMAELIEENEILKIQDQASPALRDSNKNSYRQTPILQKHSFTSNPVGKGINDSFSNDQLMVISEEVDSSLTGKGQQRDLAMSMPPVQTLGMSGFKKSVTIRNKHEVFAQSATLEMQ